MYSIIMLFRSALRFCSDAGERAAAAAAAAGSHGRHGPADLPGRGPVVFDQLARAAGGPDDHLVLQRRLLAGARAVRGTTSSRRRRRGRGRQPEPVRLFRIALGHVGRRVFGRLAVVRRRWWRGPGRPAALVVVDGPAFAVPWRPRRQHRHGPRQRALLVRAAERVVPGRQFLSAGSPSALRPEHGLVQLPRFRDLSDCSECRE